MSDSAFINEVEGVAPDEAIVDIGSLFEDGSDSIGIADEVFRCEGPHWSVSKDELKKVLQVIRSFPVRITVFLALWKDGANLHIHANNRDAFIDSVLPLLNERPYETSQVYFIESDKLQAFVGSYSQFVFSFDEKGAIYYQSLYATYKLDTLKVSLDEVRIKAEEVKEWARFPLTKAELGVLKALYGFSVKVSDSKVLIKGSTVEAFFTLYKYTVEGVPGFKEDVIVRRMDIPTVYEASDGDLQFAYTKDRVYFKFGLGVVSFLRVPYDEESFMYPASFASGEELGRFRLNVSLIKQALRLTGFLHYDVVEFRQEGDSVSMAASERVKFKVGQGEVKEPFLLNTELFARILNTVDVGEMYIDVIAAEQGMDLVLKRDTTVTYSLSRTSAAQLKKDEKAASRLEVREDRLERKKAQGTLPEQVILPPNKTLAEVFQDPELL